MDSSPVRVDAANPGPLTGPGNNTWLVDGAEPALVDAGTGLVKHLDAVAAHLDGRPLVRVLLTHGHPDHASGVPALRQRWPDLEIWKWPPIPDENWMVLGEGRQLKVGDTTVETLHTPGHAVDHVCFWHEPSRSVFVGDMLTAGTTVVIPAGRGGHLKSYLSSLERLAALEADRAYPGHGRVIDQPNVLISDYLEHRLLRERQVLTFLRQGIADPDQIVARIYPGLEAAVLPFARQTIEAHIEKLREDGFTPASSSGV